MAYVHNSGKGMFTNIKVVLRVNLKLYTVTGENCNAQILP